MLKLVDKTKRFVYNKNVVKKKIAYQLIKGGFHYVPRRQKGHHRRS